MCGGNVSPVQTLGDFVCSRDHVLGRRPSNHRIVFPEHDNRPPSTLGNAVFRQYSFLFFGMGLLIMDWRSLKSGWLPCGPNGLKDRLEFRRDE